MPEPLVFRRDDRVGAVALLAEALAATAAPHDLRREERGFEVGPLPAERRRLGVLRREEDVTTAAVRPAGDFIGVVVHATAPPGRERLAPALVTRGLRLPASWRLIVDVRDSAGWLAPRSTPAADLLDGAIEAVEAADARGHSFWRARVCATGPLLPGFSDRRS